MTRWFLVFGAVALMDSAWALYTLHVSRRNAAAAAMWSAMIILLSGFAAVSYVADHWLLTAAMAGALVGTYFTVRGSK